MNSKGKPGTVIRGLPNNFQEIVILKEMKFDSGQRDLPLIKELLYLYSLGMEYYDSINNTLLHSYYCTRNANLLSHEEVIMTIDKIEKEKFESDSVSSQNSSNSEISILLNDVIVINNLARKKKLSIYKQNTLLSDRDSYGQIELNMPDLCKSLNNSKINVLKEKSNRKPSIATIFYNAKKKEHEQIAKKVTEDQIQKLNHNNSIFDEMLSHNLNEQINCFNLRKKAKKEKFMKKEKKSLSNNSLTMNKRGSNIDDVLLSLISTSNHSIQPEDNDLLKSIMDLRENKIKTEQILMTKEIEDYIEKSMKEMLKALEELRKSFNDELRNVDVEVYPDLVSNLLEDRDADLEDLKEQYEESRRVEIEKIRAKYNSKGNLIKDNFAYK